MLMGDSETSPVGSSVCFCVNFASTVTLPGAHGESSRILLVSTAVHWSAGLSHGPFAGKANATIMKAVARIGIEELIQLHGAMLSRQVGLRLRLYDSPIHNYLLLGRLERCEWVLGWYEFDWHFRNKCFEPNRAFVHSRLLGWNMAQQDE